MKSLLNIRRNLKSLISDLKISEKKLALVSGVSQPTINKIISGYTKDPGISTLTKLSDALGVDLQTLIVSKDVRDINQKNISKQINCSFIPLLKVEDVLNIGIDSVLNLTPQTWDSWVEFDSKDERHIVINSSPEFGKFAKENSLIFLMINSEVEVDKVFLIIDKESKEYSIKKVLSAKSDILILESAIGDQTVSQETRENKCFLKVVEVRRKL